MRSRKPPCQESHKFVSVSIVNIHTLLETIDYPSENTEPNGPACLCHVLKTDQECSQERKI